MYVNPQKFQENIKNYRIFGLKESYKKGCSRLLVLEGFPIRTNLPYELITLEQAKKMVQTLNLGYGVNVIGLE